MSIYKIDTAQVIKLVHPFERINVFCSMVLESQPKRFFQFKKQEKVWNYLPVEDETDTPLYNVHTDHSCNILHFLTLQEAEEFVKHYSDVEAYRTYLKDVKGDYRDSINLANYQFRYIGDRFGYPNPQYSHNTPYNIRRCFGYKNYGYKLLYVEISKHFFGFDFCWKVVKTINSKYPILEDKIFTTENEAIEFINSNGTIEAYNMNLQELLQQKKEINSFINTKHTTLYVDGVKQKNIIID